MAQGRGADRDPLSLDPAGRAPAAGTVTAGAAPLVAVRGLTVLFPVEGGVVRAVDGISYDVEARRTLGVVGESGSGKSVAALALLRLIAPPGRIASGSITLDGVEILELDEDEMRGVRGDRKSTRLNSSHVKISYAVFC